ncbi:MAG TPA: AAA family ATPase [Oscillatoriaceae cyanobacterium M33_DOE_052]|uniref:AAA family ATPase n=1 Tax=Planktothricoides sp. SpSt-374 TaxID=2282167 RepID=A0A7C3ZJB4_9CYAN|nr:AAA family ATPase [Oscillatoriaceae cyanobacterium M33_DOE_052]
MQVTDDINKLLEIFPTQLKKSLEQHPQLGNLIEVVMDLGRLPEARFPGGAEYLSQIPVSHADLQYSTSRVGRFSGDNRAGIEQTLHRISAIRNRNDEIIGLTCRVGRAIFGTINMIRDLVETGNSILMLGRPGVGKTTALREIARVLADELNKRVVIIDTSNEIAGDGDIPHPAIGRARRMQVATPELQHKVMIEAVENHMPEVIVIDEIGTELEALAARTIAERGVQLVGTAHGNQIENLIKNPTLSDLVGGIQSVTLGDEEARRRGSQKTVLERKAPPTFQIAVEMLERQRWVVHENAAETVDCLLRGRKPGFQVRTVSETGEVTIAQESAPEPAGVMSAQPFGAGGWRASGKMQAIPLSPVRERETLGRDTSRGRNSIRPLNSQERYFEQLLNQSLPDEGDFAPSVEVAFHSSPSDPGPNGEDLPLHVYAYGVSRQKLDQVIVAMHLPVVLTKDVDSADVVLALRSNVKNHSKLRQMAKNRHIPIYTINSSTIPKIAHTLQRMLQGDDAGIPELTDLSIFTQNGSDDELEALEEARLAVEQIVIPKGQPVELLPRSAKVRKMQHELIEHYRLKSSSFGDEPNRRLRIYPA